MFSQKHWETCKYCIKSIALFLEVTGFVLTTCRITYVPVIAYYKYISIQGTASQQHSYSFKGRENPTNIDNKSQVLEELVSTQQTS